MGHGEIKNLKTDIDLDLLIGDCQFVGKKSIHEPIPFPLFLSPISFTPSPAGNQRWMAGDAPGKTSFRLSAGSVGNGRKVERNRCLRVLAEDFHGAGKALADLDVMSI